MVRNTNNKEVYEEKRKDFCEKLMKRGYSRKEFNDSSKEVDFENRNEYVKEKEQISNKIPLVFKM